MVAILVFLATYPSGCITDQCSSFAMLPLPYSSGFMWPWGAAIAPLAAIFAYITVLAFWPRPRQPGPDQETNGA